MIMIIIIITITITVMVTITIAITILMILVRCHLYIESAPRSILLPGLTGNKEFRSQHERRFDWLFNNMSASKPAICFLVTRALLSAVGFIGRNRVYHADKYQCGRLSQGMLVPFRYGAISDEAPRVQPIRELVRTRDGLVPIDTIETGDIALVLEFVTKYWSWISHWNMFEGLGRD